MLRSVARSKKVDDRPVLIVLHQERSTPGRAGQMLEARGYKLDIRRPFLGQKLPDTLNSHSGAVIFGGPMSANDSEDYIRHEIDWISVPLKENRPFLGICLGAQMLVKHLGGKVGSHTEGKTEIGWYPLQPTDEGRKLMDWPSMVYHFHREGFDLPDGAHRFELPNAQTGDKHLEGRFLHDAALRQWMSNMLDTVFGRRLI